MKRWLTYLNERFPLVTYFLLVGGISASGLYLHGSFNVKGFVASSLGLLFFFAELRLMDEYKDFEKDKVAHPTRPLPRGLLGTGEVRTAIHSMICFMVVYAAVVAVLTHWLAGSLFLGITIYLWLMYKDFYTGSWLSDRPIVYAITHQLVLVLLCTFAVATLPVDTLDGQTLFFGLSVLGAFFTYEISRKLDPDSNPVLKNYLTVYGPTRCAAFIVATSLVAAYGACGLGMGKLLWPCELVVASSLSLLFLAPKKFKIIELLATLSLVVHIWGAAARSLSGWPQ